jgi:plastocyanin
MCFSIVLFSCKKDNPVTPLLTVDNTTGTPGSTQVSMPGKSFSPGTLTINAGQTVTWTNNDSMAHTVTSNDGLFDSGNMVSGATFSFTFNTAGTYNYYCAYHGGMTGKVIVQ